MPLYEYFCGPCNGVFELLRSAKDASKPQPCPQCDEDAKRIVSKQWSAFVFREGFPRRLPDDGGYWHLGHKVSQPILGFTSGVEHPEVRSTQKEYDAPSIDEIEQQMAQMRAAFRFSDKERKPKISYYDVREFVY